MHAFILAGGFATRLWPLTERRAKPLLPLAGKPILTHLVENIPADLSITVSTNSAFAEGFQEWAKSLDRKNISIRIEQTKSDDEKLGALGAVSDWLQKESINDDVLLLTGDNYLGFSIKDFLAAAKPDRTLLAAYDIKDLKAASAFGTVILKQGTKDIEAFEEKPKEPKSSLISTGCSYLPKAILPMLIEHAKTHPDNVGGLFEALLKQHIPVDCFTFGEPWFDIGSFEAYLEATKMLVSENVIREGDAVTDESQFHGSVVLGKNSTVRNSTLTDTVLFQNCTIEDCILERCIIDDDCVLKGVDLSDKMLRKGTILIK